ncbi:alanine:cation symporter family protein [Bacteriovoracales bacterium]|nr:alanine:cation symporter family protein [Bacteriovoracales bacterium]
MISDFLSTLVDYAWGLPLIVLLLGGGLYLAVISRFTSLRGFLHAIQLIRGKHHSNEKNVKGQLSHFQALTNALSATIGLGNIAGVAVAMGQGGPGAIFWMWISALIGMNTKFFECSLAVMYRGKDYLGETQGGPMYVLEQGLGKWAKPLAVFFAICGLGGTLALFNVNQLTSFMHSEFKVDPLILGIILAIITGYVVFGGVKRIASFTSKIVPFMCVLYVGLCLIIIFQNLGKVPELLMTIVNEAFTGKAAGGGAMGMGLIFIMRIGVKRAAFSNEAGIGTAPMAHGNAKTNEPISEGLVAMLGPFIDTVVVCTMTALVILISLSPEEMSQGNGVLMTLKAFEHSFGYMGKILLGISIFFFSFSSIFGFANYNKKCWDYLFKGRWFLGDKAFTAFYLSSIILGAVATLDDVVNILDICFAFMAIPNMIGTVLLSKKVKESMAEYFKKYNI